MPIHDIQSNHTHMHTHEHMHICMHTYSTHTHVCGAVLSLLTSHHSYLSPPPPPPSSVVQQVSSWMAVLEWRGERVEGYGSHWKWVGQEGEGQ